jgi:hypothetical protein
VAEKLDACRMSASAAAAVPALARQLADSIGALEHASRDRAPNPLETIRARRDQRLNEQRAGSNGMRLPASGSPVRSRSLAAYGVDFTEGHVAWLHRRYCRRRDAGGETTSDRDRRNRRAPADSRASEALGRRLPPLPYCHAWEVRDQPLGVLGTGTGSVEHAQLIRQWSDDIVFFTHTHDMSRSEREQLEARGIRIVDGEVRALVVQDDRLKGVVLGDGRTVERAALFVRPDVRPRLHGFVAQLGFEVDDGGFVRVDDAGQTSVAGVWAAGNVANPRAQVITAAGEGSAAAISINADLVQEDVGNALPAAPQGSRP